MQYFLEKYYESEPHKRCFIILVVIVNERFVIKHNFDYLSKKSINQKEIKFLTNKVKYSRVAVVETNTDTKLFKYNLNN